ncbi:MAG: long-chain fatty acid--CoA ligase [Ktedonobacteraceae bacterium]
MNFSSVIEHYAHQHPERIAIIFEKRRLTYHQLSERINALAAVFQELGLKAGDVVAILLNNCSEFIETILAINKVGAIALPVNWRLAGDELAYVFNHSSTRLLVSESHFAPVVNEVRARCQTLSDILAVGSDIPPDWCSYTNLMNSHSGMRVPDADVGLDTIHRLMYTSGTTARPKGVMISYGNLYWKNIAHITLFDITSVDRTLIVGPLYHVGGLDLPATGVLYAGGSVVILPKFDPVRIGETVEQEQITNIWLAPAAMNMLLQDPNIWHYKLNSVRFIIGGGEKMPIPLIEKILKLFPQVWFADAYGLTETVSGDTFLDKESIIKKLGSVGRPCLHLEMRILDETGQDMPIGHHGEIVLKGPKVFKGYWKDQEATASALRDGWFHTGDIGYMDAEGYLYIVDRKKDIIISGGENVASLEVERVIYEDPRVLETAIIGIPHPRWGEVPIAYVVPKPGQVITEDELRSACLAKLAKFKVPQHVLFVDVLPRNPSGKVLKRELRNRAPAEVAAKTGS